MEMMEKMDKNKIFIIGIYLIFLVLFIIIFRLMKTNTDEFISIALELKKPIDTRYYKPIFSIFCYAILSTYYMVRALNICMSKLTKTLIQVVGYSFGLISIYMCYKVELFTQFTLLTFSLLVLLNEIYNDMHKSKQVET